MKITIFIFLIFTLSSCSSITEDKLLLLNGYWEITEVEFPNGGKKEYKISSDVDFFMVDDLKGYRKKVKPRFDGSFETSDDAEPFIIVQEDDIFLIQYQNELSTWKEYMISLSDTNFSVKNEEGIVYHYKRFEPININP